MNACEVKIDYSSHTDAEESSEKYGKWSSDTDNHFQDSTIEIVGENDYHDLTIGFTPEADKDYYLVVCEYSMGDSFGDSLGNVEFINLCEPKEYAEKLAKAYSKGSDLNRWDPDYKKPNYSFKYPDEKGKVRDFHRVWVGYFEKLESCEVYSVRLK